MLSQNIVKQRDAMAKALDAIGELKKAGIDRDMQQICINDARIAINRAYRELNEKVIAAELAGTLEQA